MSIPLINKECEVEELLDELFELTKKHPEMFKHDFYGFKKVKKDVDKIETRINQIIKSFRHFRIKEKKSIFQRFSRLVDIKKVTGVKSQIFDLFAQLLRYYSKNPEKIMNNVSKEINELFLEINDTLFNSYVLKVVNDIDSVVKNGFKKKVSLKQRFQSLFKHIRGNYGYSKFISVINPYQYYTHDFVRKFANRYIEKLKRSNKIKNIKTKVGIVKIDIKSLFDSGLINRIYLPKDIYAEAKLVPHRYLPHKKSSAQKVLLDHSLSLGEIVIELNLNKDKEGIFVFIPPKFISRL